MAKEKKESEKSSFKGLGGPVNKAPMSPSLPGGMVWSVSGHKEMKTTGEKK